MKDHTDSGRSDDVQPLPCEDDGQAPAEGFVVLGGLAGARRHRLSVDEGDQLGMAIFVPFPAAFHTI